jgi:glycosyltransferase involved in cell wall biosynthesis
MIVMLVCHFDDTNIIGGLEGQAGLLSRNLALQGEDVVVLSSTRRPSRAGWHVFDGLRTRLFWTYTTPQVSGRKLPASLIWAAQLLVWIFINRRKIDVLHGHQIRIHAFVGAIARKFWGIPHILKSATGGEGADIKAIGSRKYLGEAGRRFVIGNTDRFIAISATISDDLRSHGVPDDKIVLIPNGLVIPDLDSSTDAAVRVGRSVFFGRLAPDKNALPLARAAAETLAGTGLSLDFYGRGAQLRELEAIVAENGGRGVSYRGFSGGKAAEILGGYGWLLLPSDAEGLSNAMLEAMASGVVPVATRVSGCIEHIVPGETGFFFEGVDAASLKQGLILVASVGVDKWAKMSRAVRSYAIERFDILKVTKAYRDLYRTIELSRSI